MTKTTGRFFQVIYTLIVIGSLLLWVMQDSVNAYWSQTYHRQSPLAKLSRYTFWQRGRGVHQYLLEKMSMLRWQTLERSVAVKLAAPEAWQGQQTETKKVVSPPAAQANADVAEAADKQPVELLSVESIEQLTKHNQPRILRHSPLWRADDSLRQWQYLSFLPGKGRESNQAERKALKPPLIALADNAMLAHFLEAAVQQQTVNKEKITTQRLMPQSLTLSRGQMVFFAGDSLMQGVAPHVRHTLRKKYGIKSIDLSKQSTGLSYASFFDWHKTIKNTLDKHKNIAVLVVFLGPNDPWDMPNPQGGKYLSFQSTQWEKIYRDKIRQIIQSAKQHNVQVLWLGVPDMRKKKLNSGVRYLNTLYRSEVEKAGAMYLPTQFLLAGKMAGYSKHVSTEMGKTVAVRTNDGIHFTRAGQQRIARRILSRIAVKEN